jgi:NADH-quinone oxidoreductase subunit J
MNMTKTLAIFVGLLAIAAAYGQTAAPAAAPPAALTVPAAAPADPTGEAVAFYLVAGAAALAALGCVIATNIVRMAMCLLGALGAVALLYFLLGASFLGVIQIIVYAGGTLIVIVFGVMLTSRTYGERMRARPLELAAGLVVGLALLTGLVTILRHANWAGPGVAVDAAGVPATFTTAQIGAALLSPYLLPFELASVLLLAVMIGAAYLASPVHRKSGQG